MEACKEAGLKARGSKIRCKSQNKWFDQECKTEKENLKSLGEKIFHNTNNSEMRQLLRVKRRGLNKLVDGRNGSISAKACLLSIHCKMKRANSAPKMGPKRVSPERYCFWGQFSPIEMGLFWYQNLGLNWPLHRGQIRP